MVLVALGVVVGEKLPHCALPQVTDQVTPALVLSLVTTAANAALVVAASEVGGAGLRATVMGAAGAVIVIEAVTDLVESDTEVAVTVTVAGLGTLAGAVNVVAVPLAVEVGVTLPQDEPPQVTVQVTPPFALSLLTTAVKDAVALVPSEATG